MRIAIWAMILISLYTYTRASSQLEIPFPLPNVEPLSIPNLDFDIRDYGAVGDGKTLNTKAIAAAIEACANQGGGRVVIPPGTWLTGPIHLKSRVNLHIKENATLLFSTNMNEYLPPVFTRWQGVECMNYSPLVYARNCTGIAISGKGMLDGQGVVWWQLRSKKRESAAKLYEMILSGIPPEKRIFGTEKYPLRPSFIQPIECKKVLIEGVTVKNGPMWTVHPVYCEDVIVRQIKVETQGPNTDGLALDSCKNVLVEDCWFSTGDDCIVIKSGLDADGWRVGKPSENILIRRCRMERGHGGVVIGSEMSGGVRNVLAEDCELDGTERAVRMKTRLGRGGIVENVWFRNLKAKQIKGEVVLIDMRYGSGAVEPATTTHPTFRKINISDITCDRASRAIMITGLTDNPVREVTFKNIQVEADKGVYCEDAQGVEFYSVQIEAKSGPLFQLNNVENVIIKGSKCPERTDTLLEVTGKSRGVCISASNLANAKTQISFGNGVPADAVTIE